METDICKDIGFQLYIYKTYVRPLLEYNTEVWSPYLLGDINAIEKVQRFFTKRLPGLWIVPYLDRLQQLTLESLESRRIASDLIFMYKIVNNLVDLDMNNFFSLNSNSTRGHNLKINFQHARLNCRKYFFVNRTIPIWNQLPNEIVNCSNVNAFKNKIANYNIDQYCRGHAFTAAL